MQSGKVEEVEKWKSKFKVKFTNKFKVYGLEV
jgi:hypothetical protein